MATDYLELNREVLEKLKREAPIKYRSLKRYLECQNIYAQNLQKVGDEEKAWQAAVEHWNEWANELLRERQCLKELGLWETGVDVITKEVYGKSEPTRSWMEKSATFFDGITFYQKDINESIILKEKTICIVESILFNGFIFPGYSDFSNTNFCGYSSFISSTFYNFSSFESANFKNYTDFKGATFKNVARFLGAEFSYANFKNTEFGSDIVFQKALFKDVANFEDMTCDGNSDFNHATFEKLANFVDVSFDGKSSFRYAIFEGLGLFTRVKFNKPSDFYLSEFRNPVSFHSATFENIADFRSIRSEKGFDLSNAWFKVIPNLDKATFHSPPALDAVHIEDQLVEKSWIGPLKFKHVPAPHKNAQKISRTFRRLGKIAHEQRDWLNEMEFFAQEIRSRRLGEDFPFGKNMGRFWFGLIYEKLSNFGRSFARPVLGWLASFFLFAAIYTTIAVLGTCRSFTCSYPDFAGNTCVGINCLYALIAEDSPLWDALTLSWRQGLVISGLMRNAHYDQLLMRLFDRHPGNGVFELDNFIYILTSIQTLVSGLFLFLFFLAVRNHFRIG